MKTEVLYLLKDDVEDFALQKMHTLSPIRHPTPTPGWHTRLLLANRLITRYKLKHNLDGKILCPPKKKGGGTIFWMSHRKLPTGAGKYQETIYRLDSEEADRAGM